MVINSSQQGMHTPLNPANIDTVLYHIYEIFFYVLSGIIIATSPSCTYATSFPSVRGLATGG